MRPGRAFARDERGGMGGMTVSFKVATINLYHFAEPGIWWYACELEAPPPVRPCFDAVEWAAKTVWLSGVLADMDADLIGFQEVVSVEALRLLCAEAGYPYFATVAEPRIIEEGGERVYRRPVQAAAARVPFEAAPVRAPEGFAAALGLTAWDFRRPPLAARLEAPGIGPVAVFCCHLKSPGVSVEDAPMAGVEALAPERRAVEAISRAHAFAAMQRVLEASALRHAACEEIARGLAAGAPPLALVIGDLNDAPDSPALRALTADAPFERDGGAAAEGGGVSGNPYQLFDAYRLSPRHLSTDHRPATHRSGAQGAAIDFVLASGCGRGGPIRLASHQVWDRHFIAGAPRTSSDHAPVSAGFEAWS